MKQTSVGDPLATLARRLRDLRRSRQLAMKELAQQAGVSIGLLSQLERGTGNPSYLTLAKLAGSLGVPVNYFFDADGSADPYLVRRQDRKRLVPARRDAIFELVTPNLRGQLEVLWIELDPGGEEPNPYQHDGEECVLVVAGSVRYHLGDRIYDLRAGDSVTFPGTMPHWAVNRGKRPATLVVAITPPSF